VTLFLRCLVVSFYPPPFSLLFSLLFPRIEFFPLVSPKLPPLPSDFDTSTDPPTFLRPLVFSLSFPIPFCPLNEMTLLVRQLPPPLVYPLSLVSTYHFPPSDPLFFFRQRLSGVPRSLRLSCGLFPNYTFRFPPSRRSKGPFT